MARSLIVISGMLLSAFVMACYGEAVQRLSEQVSKSEGYTPVRTVKMEVVGETGLGIPVYQTRNGNCFDIHLDQVSCPN